MREIDFLPEWYRSSKRRQDSYRLQYAILGGAFMVMLIWNFIVIGSISRAQAKLAAIRDGVTKAENISNEYKVTSEQKDALQKKADILSGVDSKINIASILGEISFLVGDRIALSRVEFAADDFSNKGGSRSGGSRIRAARGKGRAKTGEFSGDIRFKVVINGIASDSGDVAGFICRMEESPYFRRVHPGYSRNRKIKPSHGKASETMMLSEFQISCYLANYTESTVK